MSLSDKLAQASVSKSIKLCKIGVILESDKISKADRENLKAVLDAPENTPNRIPNTHLGRILREEGHDVSNSAVDRHRRRDCPCTTGLAK